MRKYRNIPTCVDGIRFDSQKEARRYKELQLLQMAGEISHLERQKTYILSDKVTLDGKLQQPIKYKCDFCYFDKRKNDFEVEDVKGVITQDFKNKRKLMKQRYNIEVKII